MAVFLGIDVSTTASKALLINENGDVLATASHAHTLQTPRPLWSEQDPLEWWQAVSASIRAALEKAGIGGEAISAVGLTGQMHGLVLLDEAGEVLRPAILWNDGHTQAQWLAQATHNRLIAGSYPGGYNCNSIRVNPGSAWFAFQFLARVLLSSPSSHSCNNTSAPPQWAFLFH